MAYDKFRQEATYEAPDVQPDQGLYKHAFATAMQQDFQRAEGDKNREEAQKDAERKRLLALKPTAATAPFEVDANDIAVDLNEQANAITNGNEEEHLKRGRRAVETQNLSKLQYNRYNNLVKEVEKVAGKYPDIVKNDVVRNFKNNIEKKGAREREPELDSFGNTIINTPEEVYDAGKWADNFINAKKEETFDYDFSDQYGNKKISQKNKTITRHPVDDLSSPIYVYNQNGQKIQKGYEQKPATTIQEAMQFVPEYMQDPDFVRTVTGQSYKDNKKSIDEAAKVFANTADANGNKPSGSDVAVFVDEQKKDYAEKFIAEKIVGHEKARKAARSYNRTTEYIKPSEPEINRSKARTGGSGDNYDQIATAHVSHRTYETEAMDSKGKVLGKQKTTVPVTVKLTNNKGELVGKNATIDPTVKMAYSNSTGKATQDIPKAGTYTGTHFLIEKTKNGKTVLDVTAHQDPVARIKELKELGYTVNVNPFESYTVYSQKNPYKDEADKADYAKLLRLKAEKDTGEEMERLEAKFAKNQDEIFVPSDKSNVSKFGESNRKLLYATKDQSAIKLYEDMVGATKAPVKVREVNKGIAKTPEATKGQPKKMIGRGAGAKPVYEGKVVNKGGKKLGE